MAQITNAPDAQQPFVNKQGFITRAWFQWLLNIIGSATTGGDVTHTGTLTSHHVILGNGGADIKALSGIGTSGQILTSNGAAADPSFQAPATSGTVTHTGALTAGKLIQGNGTADITVNATTATVTKLTAGTPSAASAGTDYVAPGSITTDGITMSTARLLGRTTAATGAVEEITAGTGLTLSAGTLTATGTGGTVTTTGSPASGNLTKFSGATSITNADLTGDVTTSGTVATTLATVNANVGTFGDGTHVAQVTVNGKGLVTAAANVAITNAGTVTHTAGALTLNQLVYGAGSADIKVTAATDGQVPIGTTSDGTAALSTLTAGTGVSITNAANSITISASGGGVGTALPSTIEGRITVQTGVPVPTSDQTAKATLYFTPSTLQGIATTNGNLTLYNGSALINVAYTQLSLGLSGLTSGKNYDVFVDYNSGSPQIVLSAAWASDSTRTDAIGLQSGLLIKSGTPAYRWVGTIRTTGTTTTEDSQSKRYVWNAFNRVQRILLASDTTQHSYSTSTWRAWNNSSANKVECVVGSIELPIAIHIFSGQDSSGPNGEAAASLNWTSGTPGGPVTALSQSTTGYTGHADVRQSLPVLGYNFIAVIENGGGSGTQTFYNYTTNSQVWA